MRNKRIRVQRISIIPIILFLLAAGFFLVNERYPLIGQPVRDEFVRVTTVHDGDTVSAVIGTKVERIRFIGIDAPEMGQKPWGAEAKRKLEALLDSSQWKVRLEYDIEERDKYGRILAYLWTSDGKMINGVMLKSGYAMLFTVPPNVRYADELETAQREARERKSGIWSEKGLKERPSDYRRAHPRR